MGGEAHEANSDAIIYGAIKTFRNGRFEQVLGANHESLPRGMIPHPATFVPLSVYTKYGLYDERYSIAADYEAFLRYYLKGVPFKFIDRIICEFDLGGISGNDPLTQEETFRIRERYGVLSKEEKSPKRTIKRRMKIFLRRIAAWR